MSTPARTSAFRINDRIHPKLITIPCKDDFPGVQSLKEDDHRIVHTVQLFSISPNRWVAGSPPPVGGNTGLLGVDISGELLSISMSHTVVVSI